MASRHSLSSTTTTEKFCMLSGVGAQRAASRINFTCCVVTARSGLKGPLVECLFCMRVKSAWVAWSSASAVALCVWLVTMSLLLESSIGSLRNRMIQARMEGVEFITANTDVQALKLSHAPVKLQLGVRLTLGLGAGSNPDVGRSAALEDSEKIIEALEGADTVRAGDQHRMAGLAPRRCRRGCGWPAGSARVAPLRCTKTAPSRGSTRAAPGCGRSRRRARGRP